MDILNFRKGIREIGGIFGDIWQGIRPYKNMIIIAALIYIALNPTKGKEMLLRAVSYLEMIFRRFCEWLNRIGEQMMNKVAPPPPTLTNTDEDDLFSVDPQLT